MTFKCFLMVFPMLVFLGTMVQYTFQCHLNIQELYEKVFFIFWIWLIFLSAANFVSFWTWLIRIMGCSTPSGSFISAILKSGENNQLLPNECHPVANINKRNATSFVNSYLKCDGRLILSLLAYNSNPLLLNQVGKMILNLETMSKTWSN